MIFLNFIKIYSDGHKKVSFPIFLHDGHHFTFDTFIVNLDSKVNIWRATITLRKTFRLFL